MRVSKVGTGQVRWISPLPPISKLSNIFYKTPVLIFLSKQSCNCLLNKVSESLFTIYNQLRTFVSNNSWYAGSFNFGSDETFQDWKFCCNLFFLPLQFQARSDSYVTLNSIKTTLCSRGKPFKLIWNEMHVRSGCPVDRIAAQGCCVVDYSLL